MSFQDFPCNKCGWCCQRTPCPLGLFLGQTPLQPCSFLKESSPNEFICSIISEEKNELKKEAAKSLILSGEGCSHKYGPSPKSLMIELIKRGLSPGTEKWEFAKTQTEQEYNAMIKDSMDAIAIHSALKDFEDFCQEFEN